MSDLLNVSETEVERLQQLLVEAERNHLQAMADAWHEGWIAGVRDACTTNTTDPGDADDAVRATEESGLEENTYLARLEADPVLDDRPDSTS